MLSGFNTNFRYRGVLFHVQTEDSGRENPHIITHLFYGGNILASEKSEYADLFAGDDDEIEDVVRKRMETQHKSMLKRLSRGEHDRVIGERLGPDALGPAAAGSGSTTASEDPTDSGTDSSTPAPPAAPDAAVAPATAENSPGRFSRVFGDRVVSEKPLDEVVLDYLVENARKRKRKPQ